MPENTEFGDGDLHIELEVCGKNVGEEVGEKFNQSQQKRNHPIMQMPV